MLRKLLEALIAATILKIKEVDYRRPYVRSVVVIERWK